jgi:hypothetical protein
MITKDHLNVDLVMEQVKENNAGVMFNGLA